MLSLVLAGSLLASGLQLGAGQFEPPAVPDAPIDTSGDDSPSEAAIVVVPALGPASPAPASPELAPSVAGLEPAAGISEAVARRVHLQAAPTPPGSGAGRFVGGSVMFVAGLGLLAAATLEYSSGRDSTKLLIGQAPAGIVMLVAGGAMVGTGTRDLHRLSEWEAATKTRAKPMGTGFIVGGVTAISLGSLAAVATSVAADMDLNAPRSIPAGWATAGVVLAGGTALLIAGIVRRSRYEKWRNKVTGMPMVTPTRAGATIGVAGQF